MTFINTDFSAVIPDIKKENSVKEMLSVRKEGKKTFVRINSSSIGIILSCPRKSYYSLHRKLQSRTGSPALIFGSAIHKALEVFYGQPKGTRSIPKGFNEHSDLMAFGTPAPEAHFLYSAIAEFVKAAQPLVGLPQSDKRSIPNGIWTLQHYFKTYIDDIYQTYSDKSGPMSERTFSLVISDTETLQVEIFGTIDVVLQNGATGEVLPGDHKTVTYLGSDFYSRLKPNHQYSCYILGAQQALGLKGNNFLVNALQVKPRPVTARGSAPNFTRQVTTRTEEELQEFRDAVMYCVTQYLGWLESGVWPIGDVNACSMYSGCAYLEVCSAPHSLRENIISAKYDEGEK